MTKDKTNIEEIKLGDLKKKIENSFMDYMQDVFDFDMAQTIPDDEMPDAFDAWFSELSAEDVIYHFSYFTAQTFTPKDQVQAECEEYLDEFVEFWEEHESTATTKGNSHVRRMVKEFQKGAKGA